MPRTRRSRRIGRWRGEARGLYEAGAEHPVYLGLSDSGAVDKAYVVGNGNKFSVPLLRISDPQMVVIPAGSFVMGSPLNEADRESDEGPQRTVTVRSFAVGKYEVTFAEWDACVVAGGCNGYRPDDNGWGRGNRPVINVSWQDAQAYVFWLSAATGKRYRLLTEAEWEYAARAGTTTPWSCGESESCLSSAAVYSANSGGKTASIGSKAANAYGVYDMHGNVWEWVQDCDAGYTGAPMDGSAVEANDSCNRVIRGGSWVNNPNGLRAANRNKEIPRIRSNDRGIRLARTLP